MARQANTGSGTASPRPSSGDARRVALVLAVAEYDDPTLRRLRSPAGDADEFGQVLSSPELGGFDVTSMLNGRAYEMRLAVQDFLSACGPEDLALVYLSCHGLVDARRRLYFAATDTLTERLAATAVEARWLLDQLEECRARRQVVILDCCFSGAFATGTKGGDTVELGDELLGQGRGRVVLTASRATEYSFEGTPTKGAAIAGSVFTAALASGIRTGAADTDGDGYISVDDAYTYAFDELRAAGAEQTPQRWLYGAEGDIVLARNPAATGSDAAVPEGRAARPGTTQVSGRPRPRPPRWWKGRRAVWWAVAATLVVAVVAAGLVLWQPWTDGGDESADTFTFHDGRFVDTSAAWHLTVSAGPDAPAAGCTVAVREESRSGPVISSTRHRSTRSGVILQVGETGSFYLDYANGCLVTATDGAGDEDYPVQITAGVGDSLAWNPGGSMELTAEESGSYPCAVYMVDAETGGADLVTIRGAGDLEAYTPPDTSSLYMSLSGTNCVVTARDAGTASQ